MVDRDDSANGTAGFVRFDVNSTGGAARVELFGNGSLTMTFQNASGVTIGSLEGRWSRILERKGSDDWQQQSQHSLFGCYPGRRIRDEIGTGRLAVSGANTYTGGTTIQAGQLGVNNTSGSGAGSGAVSVNAGTLGGRGTIAGAVVVGTGNGAGAFLAPGANRTATFTIQSRIYFKADATYTYTLNTRRAEADGGDRQRSADQPRRVVFSRGVAIVG